MVLSESTESRGAGASAPRALGQGIAVERADARDITAGEVGAVEGTSNGDGSTAPSTPTENGIKVDSSINGCDARSRSERTAPALRSVEEKTAVEKKTDTTKGAGVAAGKEEKKPAASAGLADEAASAAANLGFFTQFMAAHRVVQRLPMYRRFIITRWLPLTMLRVCSALSLVVAVYVVVNVLDGSEEKYRRDGAEGRSEFDVMNLSSDEAAILGVAVGVVALGQFAPMIALITLQDLTKSMQVHQASSIVAKIFDLPHSSVLAVPAGEFSQLMGKVFHTFDPFLPALYNDVLPTMAQVFVMVIVLLATGYGWGLMVIQVAFLTLFTLIALKQGERKAARNREVVKLIMNEWGKILGIAGSYEQAHYFGNVRSEIEKAENSFAFLSGKMMKIKSGENWDQLSMFVLRTVSVVLFIGVFWVTKGSEVAFIEFCVLCMYIANFCGSLDRYRLGISNVRIAAVEYQTLVQFIGKKSEIQDIPGAEDISVRILRELGDDGGASFDAKSNLAGGAICKFNNGDTSGNDTGKPSRPKSSLLEVVVHDPLPSLSARDALPGISIEFQNVSFTYGGKEILKDVSFKLPAGKRLGLVGSSGCGKSTIIRLLLRFYQPSSGIILINNVDTRTVTADSLRRLFSVVSQDPQVFNATLRDNIVYGKKGSSDAEILEAGRRAGLTISVKEEEVGAASGGGKTDGDMSDDINGMRDHDKTAPTVVSTAAGDAPSNVEAAGSHLYLDKPCGEKGGKLSGGQQQRVALAKALLKNAPVFVMDEPTTGLDGVIAKQLEETMEEISRSSTTIWITHHLTDLKNADIIAYLHDGEIVERGTFGELMQIDGGKFKQQVEARDQ